VVKRVPDLEKIKAEAYVVLQKTLKRAGDLLENEWVGRETRSETGTLSEPGYQLSARFRVQKGDAATLGKIWQLQAIIKSVVHPKQAHQVVWEVQRRSVKSSPDAPIYPILIAPYISDSVAEICREANIGYLDLSGNCDIEFGGIWINIEKQERKYKEARVLKSLYTPKAARVLRVLLQGPLRGHKTEELARTAGVSLGLVSKIRKYLVDHELAQVIDDGLKIIAPQAVLEGWLKADDFHERIESRDYSLVDFDPAKVAQRLDAVLDEGLIKHAYTQWFAAWLRAPYALPPLVSIYVKEFPEDDILKKHLGARRVAANSGRLRLIKSADFRGVTIGQQKAKGFPIVSDVQIYLDLAKSELGSGEQAEELRKRDDFAGGWK
jgi:hypothetical protein